MPFVADPADKQSRFTPDAQKEVAATEAPAENAAPVPANHGLGADTVAGANAGITGLLGLPVDTAMNVWDLGKAGLGYAQSKITGHAPSEIFDPSDRAQYAGTSAWLDKMAKKYAGIDTANPDPQSGAGRFAYAAGTAVPSALMAQPETLGQTARAIGANVVPALAGQAAADKFPNSRAAPIIASLLTQAAPAAIRQAAAAVPSPQEQVTPAAQTLLDAGVTLDKGQRTGSDNWAQVRRWVNDNPFTQPGQKRFSDQQLGQFNEALVSAMGEDGKAATPEVMNNARRRIGTYYDAVNERVPINIDPKLGTDVQQIMQEAQDVLPQDQYNQLNKQMENVQLKGGYGQITFRQWQPVKKALDNMVAAGDSRAQFAKQLRGSFTEALTRSATGTDAQLLQDANRQWQAMKQIQQAVPSDGTGIITPARLAQVLHTQRNQYQSVFGGGNQDLVDLAHAGKQVLTEKAPNSGTAYRAGLQFLADNPVSTILGVRGAGPLIAQRILNSQPGAASPSLGPDPRRVLSYVAQDALQANRSDNVPGFAQGGAVDTDALAKMADHYTGKGRGRRATTKPLAFSVDSVKPNPLAGALPDLSAGNPSEVPGAVGVPPPAHEDGIASITDAMAPYFEGYAEGGQVDAPYDYREDLKTLQHFDDGGRVGDPFSMDWYNTYGEGPEFQWTQPQDYGSVLPSVNQTPTAQQTTQNVPVQQTGGIPLNQIRNVTKGVSLPVSSMSTGLTGGSQAALNGMGANLALPGTTLGAAPNLVSPSQGALNGMGSNLSLPGQSLQAPTNAFNPSGQAAANLGQGLDLGGTAAAGSMGAIDAGTGLAAGANTLGAVNNVYDLSNVAAPAMPAVQSGLGSALGTGLGALGAGYGVYNAVNNWKSGATGSDALNGAEAGAGVGTAVAPGIGTVIGGLIGGAAGALSSAFGPGQSVADQMWRAYNKSGGNVNPMSISPTDMQHIWGGGYTSNENGALKQLNAALAGTYGNQHQSEGQAWNYEKFVKDAVTQAQAGGQNVAGMTPQQLYSQVVQPYTQNVYGADVANSVPKSFANVVGTYADQVAQGLAKTQATPAPAPTAGPQLSPQMMQQLQLARGALHLAAGGGVHLPKLGGLGSLSGVMRPQMTGLSAGVRRENPGYQFTRGITHSMSLSRPLFKAGRIKQLKKGGTVARPKGPGSAGRSR